MSITIPIPVGYWADLDEDCDISINAMLSPTAKLERITTELRGIVTVAMLDFGIAGAEEDLVPRRFIIQDVEDPCVYYVLGRKSFDGCHCHLVAVFSFVDLEGTRWWIFEDVLYKDEVLRNGCNLNQIELLSQINALERLCMLTEVERKEKSFRVDVSGFSPEAVEEFVGKEFFGGFSLEYDQENCTILLTEYDVTDPDDDGFREYILDIYRDQDLD